MTNGLFFGTIYRVGQKWDSLILYSRKFCEHFSEICFILSWMVAAEGRTKVVPFLAHSVYTAKQLGQNKILTKHDTEGRSNPSEKKIPQINISINTSFFCTGICIQKKLDSTYITQRCYKQWSHNYHQLMPTHLPSVLWRCWLSGRKGIRPVKTWEMRCWHGYLSVSYTHLTLPTNREV